MAPDMLQVGEYIQVTSGDDLLKHCMNNNVASCATNSSTKIIK